MGLDYFFIFIILAGALAGGFVSGLAGFGTGITALGLWLFVLPPSVAATLVIVCSVAAQLLTLSKIWHAVEFRRISVFVIPGLVGVPVGTVLLSFVDVKAFKLGIALLLIFYSINSLFQSSSKGSPWGGRTADASIGFGGGVLGGLAGLSGPLPTIWADFRGWAKDEKRSVFQVFNLTILLAALVSHLFAGFLTQELAWAAAFALPGTFTGAWLGSKLYTHVSDKRFREIILVLLGISGCVLIWSNI